MSITLTERELKECAEHPVALRAIADWHDAQEAGAEAADYLEAAKFHGARSKELRAEADRIEASY